MHLKSFAKVSSPILIGFLLNIIFILPAETDTIIFKSGKTLSCDIVDRTKEWIEVDQGIGVLIRYYMDEIERIGGKDVSSPVPSPTPDVSLEVNQKLVNWLMGNVSPQTQLPFSFQVVKDKEELYNKMGKAMSTTGIVERMIVAEGISIYDAAVWQIALTMLGGEDDLAAASVPVDIYWAGRLGELENIRAGFSGQPFIYDPEEPTAVTSHLDKEGQRGFIFRILNANGKYRTEDPLDGKTEFAEFPNYTRIHWEDWKPIAGENAWVIMAALHLYHKKYYDSQKGSYKEVPDPVELRLAEEIARAGILLQANNGGIRMAPLGTYYHLIDIEESESLEDIGRQLDEYARKVKAGDAASLQTTRKIGDVDYHEHHIWYYEEISTENNLSWYAALRMLYGITGKEEYLNAMEDIEKYMKSAWNYNEENFFQGAHLKEGIWQPNTEYFATDVQNWAIIVLGPEKIDNWFGEGAAYRIWEETVRMAGYMDEQGRTLGVGFTEEKQRLSIEWTAGAIFSVRTLTDHYRQSHPDWAQQAQEDEKNMRRGIEKYKIVVSDSEESYAYSSKRDWIPFGWFSHDPGVLSLVSAAWVALVDVDFNPFYLKQKK